MATNSSILAWRIPQTEESGRLQSMGLQESDMTERLSTAHIGSSDKFNFLANVHCLNCAKFKIKPVNVKGDQH